MAKDDVVEAIPKAALWGAAVLLGLTILTAVAGRVGDFGTLRVPEAEALVTRDLRFADRADGAVLVMEGTTDRIVEVLPPGTNGFVRGVLRGMARGRKLDQLGPETPFRLTLRADGRLSLSDPATGRQVELNAFGATNLEAFAQLLPDTNRGRP